MGSPAFSSAGFLQCAQECCRGGCRRGISHWGSTYRPTSCVHKARAEASTVAF
jgi:hypothetical protein